MNTKILLPVLGIGVLVILGGWYFLGNKSEPTNPAETASSEKKPGDVVHTLTLKERTLAPDMVTVTEGDQVTIKVTSDEDGEFHISGYEIENDMTAGAVLSFSFTADKAGRYNFELHPAVKDEEHALRLVPVAQASETQEGEEEDIVVGALVVNPR